jgi:hypothetical protein
MGHAHNLPTAQRAMTRWRPPTRQHRPRAPHVIVGIVCASCGHEWTIEKRVPNERVRSAQRQRRLNLGLGL